METDARYFWRRAVEEVTAARRALTPAAKKPHQQLARLYLDRLAQLGAPTPFGAKDLDAEFRTARRGDHSQAA